MADNTTTLTGGITRSIARLLPRGWHVETYHPPCRTITGKQSEIDLLLIGPGGRTIAFDVFFDDGTCTPEQLMEDLSFFLRDTFRPVVVVADNLADGIVHMLDREEINYVDTTGRVSITCGSPLVVLRAGTGACHKIP
ncbi:hypothetical protein ACFSSC_00485 [Corynebacterium mendelii]|uniref:Uncharacterized protein n=1 Tax=Corynebacterium mendelii TaxID=2765362 RepID=A0A939IX70_9CORY|nr:hypothetical protein [Corynebacterium mendelii]MBN9643763.1 hypothetical protein [Corynebacterium mendelii]